MYFIYVLLTSLSQVRMLLMHEVKNDDNIKNFFAEIYELFVKVFFTVLVACFNNISRPIHFFSTHTKTIFLQVILNPFYTPGSPITSKDFAAKVKLAARRFL
jgi:hypothetical protein